MNTANNTKNGKKLRSGPVLPLLIQDDPLIARDAEILSFIKDNHRSREHLEDRSALPPQPYPLYYKYRLKPFPIHKVHGARIPRWKDTTTWLKLQLACMVLHEIGYYHFRMHIDEGLLMQWKHEGKDVTTELRNRLCRKLKENFGGNVPMLYFVAEDRDPDGNFVRPHIHGGIGVPNAPKRSKVNGSKDLFGHDLPQSQIRAINAGRATMRKAIFAATGAGRSGATTPPSARSSMHWSKVPTQMAFNTEAVDYIFKNVKIPSKILGEQRVVILNGPNGTGLRSQARQLWDVIRGTPAADNMMGLPPLST